MHRVVISGLGTVSPLGIGTDVGWKNLLAGRCAINNLAHSNGEWRALFARTGNVQVAAPVMGVASSNVFKHPRHLQFALLAAREAFEDAQLALSSRVAVVYGCGMPGLDQVATFLQQDRRASPYLIHSLLASTPATFLCKELRLQRHGPVTAPSAACATGTQAVIDAYNLLQSDANVDAVVAGATETPINYTCISGFHTIRALSTRSNQRPECSSRPFDRRRDGFVLGEGAGALVLERMDRARQRRAKVYAEVIGAGSVVDLDAHPTTPDPEGRGAKEAMCQALASVRDLSSIKGIFAHATGTPVGDDIEMKAIGAVFATDIHVAAPKASIGHTLGASGAIELAYACKSLQSCTIPGICNLEAAMNHAHSIHLSREPVSVTTTSPWIILKNSFGFGGINCAVAIRSPTTPDGTDPSHVFFQSSGFDCR